MIALLIAASLALPAAVTGDFDGDGRADTAQFVREGGMVHLEIRLASHRNATWRPPEASGKEGNLYLQTLPASACSKICTDKAVGECPAAVVSNSDAIAFGAPEASTAIVWWTGTAFKTLWISD